MNLGGKCNFSSQIQHLILYVRAVISWHPHALVEIFKCAVGHLQRLRTDCRHTSQVGLVTLVLQNCLFSEFNSVLLLQFLYHGLNKFILKLCCVDLLLNLSLNLLLGLTLNHSFASNLRVHFETAENPHNYPSLVEFFEPSLIFLLELFFCSPSLPLAYNNLLQSLSPPPVDPPVNQLVQSVVLTLTKSKPNLPFREVL